jgi:hypothetical protein
VQYLYPHCTVIIDEAARYLETRFHDGTIVASTPNDDPHTMAVATDLGYGTDTWTMSKDHEMCHTWLAHTAGQPWSDTFWRLAHPEAIGSIGDVEVSEEEAMVLDFQRTLDKAAPRPWDAAGIPVEHTLPW